MTALFFLGDGLWPQPVSVVCQGFLQSGESEAEHKEAWKTAYLSFKSPSEAIQGPFDSFVPRAGLLLNGAVILLKLGIIWELALYPLCTLQVVSLHTKDELAAVNKSRNSSMGGGEKKKIDVTNRLSDCVWMCWQLPAKRNNDWQEKCPNGTLQHHCVKNSLHCAFIMKTPL